MPLTTETGEALTTETGEPLFLEGEEVAAATDQQMQQFANERIRVRAEQLRKVKLACADDKAAIDDVYARAISGNQWSDARTDGPPKLLAAGDAANPNDVTNYNAFVELVAKFFAGTFATVEEANSAAAMWLVVQDACVRPIKVEG